MLASAVQGNWVSSVCVCVWRQTSEELRERSCCCNLHFGGRRLVCVRAVRGREGERKVERSENQNANEWLHTCIKSLRNLGEV